MTPLNLQPISKKDWDAVLTHCRRFDVEEGETPEFMYSVRSSTQTLTIWTQDGWRDGWYQARVVPKAKGAKLTLQLEGCTAPVNRAWETQKLEDHLRRLISRAAGDA